MRLSSKRALLVSASLIAMPMLATPAIGGETTMTNWTVIATGTPDPQQATNTFPSGLTITVNQTGKPGIQGDDVLIASGAGTAANYGTASATGSYAGTIAWPSPSRALSVWTAHPAANGGNGSCPTTAAGSGVVIVNCGTMTLSFNHPVRNPTIHVALVGGGVVGGVTAGVLWQIPTGASYSFIAPGYSGGQNIAVTSTSFGPNTTTASTCSSSTPTGTCGSATINGTASDFAFTIANKYMGTTIPAGSTSNDGFRFQITVDNDFGDAPASFEAGAAASHVLSDLQIGSGVTADASLTMYSAAPSASPLLAAQTLNTSALVDTDDGLSSVPVIPAGATSYSLSVPVSAVSSTATMCGWIDFNASGVYDSGERACATVGAGATSANLTWAVPTGAGLVTGTSNLRLRLGYTASQIQSPTGMADSGEVEDYKISITPTTVVAGALPPTESFGTCAYGVVDYGGWIVWNQNAPYHSPTIVTSGLNSPMVGSTAGTAFAAFPAGTDLVAAPGISEYLISSSLNINGATATGAAAAYTAQDYINYQFTTMSNPDSDLILRAVNFGKYGDATLYPFRMTVLLSSSPNFTSAFTLVDNYQVTATGGGYVNVVIPQTQQPILRPNTTYYVRAIIHDATSPGGISNGMSVPAGTVRWDDFRLSAGRCVKPATLQLQKTSETYAGNTDPLFNTPGNDVLYTISAPNHGELATDSNSVFVLDPLPETLEMYTGDMDDAGPATSAILFNAGASGLTFNPATDIGYATGATAPTSFSQCTYTPNGSYDPAVKYICLNPKGAMGWGSTYPDFSFQFRARIK